MGLPINIETLVHGKAIEWERLEFKKGWNPEEIIHSICAFANDINNWGGGYIIVGIEEKEGLPILPAHGLKQNELDNIQGEIIKLGYQILPNYFPIVQPYVLENKHILVLWCPAGDNRPYTAPSTQGKGAQRYHYIRRGSRSIIAKGDDLRKLNELAARIPFDDRVNHRANIDDFDLGLIQAFLQEIKSDLFEESKHMSMPDLARNMLIAKGSDENLRPVNVGLLFFTKQPENYFSRTWIELVVHQDDSGSNFTEQYFKGALQVQLREALTFLRTNIIREHVKKVPYQAEAIRFYNFPYEAVEEALSNAVYHKSYELGSPIEIQVWKDKIEILSFPGPVPPVDAQILANQQRIVARDYRNRRIGDFLKELDLTEGRGTGIPTIYRAMSNNGSPKPTFETDEQSAYFLVTLLIHPRAETDQVVDQENYITFNNLNDIMAFVNAFSDGVIDGAIDGVSNRVTTIVNEELHGRVTEMLEKLENWISREEMFTKIGLSNNSINRKRYLDPLIDIGWVVMEYPDTPTHPRQRYKRTPLGEKLLKLIKN